MGQRDSLAGREVHQLDDVAVAFIAGAGHRQPGKHAAVGGKRRQIVGAEVIRRQVARTCGAVGRGHEDVEVGRGRLDPPRLAQREEHGLAVRRKVELLAAAERARGRVADQVSADHRTPANHLAVLNRDGEQARLGARRRPRVPMADEQLVEGSPRAPCISRLDIGAGKVSAARVAVGEDQQPAAVLRHLEAGDVALERRQLHRLAAQRHAEQLVLILDRREVPDRTVRAEYRVMPLADAGDRDRLSAGPGQIKHVEFVLALVGREVGVAQRKDGVLAVGRDARRAHPVHHVQVDRGHRPGGERGCEQGGSRGGGEQG